MPLARAFLFAKSLEPTTATESGLPTKFLRRGKECSSSIAVLSCTCEDPLSPFFGGASPLPNQKFAPTDPTPTRARPLSTKKSLCLVHGLFWFLLANQKWLVLYRVNLK